jgi:ABC-type transport system involved in cytochrome c biogenesis permease subunit
MDRLMYHIVPLLLLVFFSALIAVWTVLARRTDARLEAVARTLGWIGAGFYLIWIVALTLVQGQVPVYNFGQLALFLGGLVWISQTYVQWRVDQRLFTLLPLVGVVTLVLVGLAAGASPDRVPEGLRGPQASFHITLSLAGVAMLLGSGVFGAGQVILHGHIRKRDFDVWFQRLPSLGDLDRLRRVTLVAGWLLITVSLVSALVWLRLRPAGSSGPVISHLHPMLLLAALITALVLADRFRWLAVQRLAWISFLLSALVVVLLLVSVIEIFVGRFA